jgi:hypothetical protein
MVMSPAGLGPENECAVEDQQLLLSTDPSSRQRECCIRTMTARVQLQKKIMVVSLKGLAPRRTDWR